MKDWIETLEAGVRLLIKVIGALILLMLLFWREPLATAFEEFTSDVLTTLERAGIRVRKGNLLGVEFDVDDARQKVAGVSRAIGDVVAKLDEAAPKAADPGLRDELADLSKRLRAAAAGAESIDVQIGVAAAQGVTERPLRSVEQSSPSPVKPVPGEGGGAAVSALSSSSAWGVVIGSDVDLSAAQDEVKRARKAVAQGGLPALDVFVFLRNNWYQTVVVFSGAGEARNALPVLREVRKSAYAVALDRWCAGPEKRDGFMACGG